MIQLVTSRVCCKREETLTRGGRTYKISNIGFASLTQTSVFGVIQNQSEHAVAMRGDKWNKPAPPPSLQKEIIFTLRPFISGTLNLGNINDWIYKTAPAWLTVTLMLEWLWISRPRHFVPVLSASSQPQTTQVSPCAASDPPELQRVWVERARFDFIYTRPTLGWKIFECVGLEEFSIRIAHRTGIIPEIHCFRYITDLFSTLYPTHPL